MKALAQEKTLEIKYQEFDWAEAIEQFQGDEEVSLLLF